jgi:hypothetical protein
MTVAGVLSSAAAGRIVFLLKSIFKNRGSSTLAGVTSRQAPSGVHSTTRMTDINKGRVPSKSPAPTVDAAMMEHKNTHTIQMYLFIVTSDQKNMILYFTL